MKKLFASGVYVIAVVILSSFTQTPPAGENFAVIVNKDNPITEITMGEAKLYFLRKLKNRWPGINKNIRPVTRKAKCVERDAFYREIIKMTDAEVDNYFAERQFQNAEKTPEKMNSEADVIAFVEQEAGGIGFINIKSATPDLKARVKVVLEF